MTEHHLPDVVVTDRGVYFDGAELPWYIAEDGISFKPVVDGFHSLTVEFLVASAIFRDSWETAYWHQWDEFRTWVGYSALAEHAQFDRITREYVL